jgi:hypothetical protein
MKARLHPPKRQARHDDDASRTAATLNSMHRIARRRFHRDRVIAKRIKLARDIAHVDLAEIVPG